MKRHALAALFGTALALDAAADELTLQPVRDNSIYQEVPGNSNGSGYLFAGNQNAGATRRSLLRFDVAGALPAGAQIQSVELRLHVSRANFAEPLPVTLHRALADWGEAGSNAGERSGAGAPAQPGDATWSHRFHATSMWSAPGADFDPVASASGALGGIGDYTIASSAPLVADVQGWLDDPDSNLGWVLRGDETQGTTARRIDSRESGAATRPQLRVTYQVPTPAVPFPGVAGVLLFAALLGSAWAAPSAGTREPAEGAPTARG